jgi:hypothetical protein
VGLQVASWLQTERGVRRAIAVRLVVLGLVPAGLTGGCFYTGDLNDRPSAEIERLTEGVPLRGETVRFQAIVVDPGDQVEVAWHVDACRTSAGAEVCDRNLATAEPALLQLEVVVPANVGAGAERGPTERLRVHLDVVDSHGAVARPSQEDVVDVGNQAPRLEVQRRGRELAGAFPEDAPIVVATRASDPEGDDVVVACEVFAPRGSVPGDWSFVPLVVAPGGDQEWRLVPDVPGVWTVRCTADDSLAQTTVDTPLTVVADRPPCLRTIDPAPLEAGALVLDAPRRFAVLGVDDDLDVFPAQPDDPFLGLAGFRWSIRPVGAAEYTEIDADVASVELDPARFTPGERLDLRVELDDRRRREIDCDVDEATCSLTLDSCLQRQTWRVEVR